jgi:peptide/nickel transport system substrate-binding protein
VTGPGGDAVEIVVRTPVAELDTLLALPQTAITRHGKAPAGDKAIGTGPFAIDALERPRKRIRLRAFDDHFNGRPYIDTLSLSWYDAADAEARRFEDGSSQLSARGTSAFAGAQPKFASKDVEGPAALLVFVGFGQAHADITSDKAFRKALDLALARATLETVTSGERVTPAREPLPVEAGGVGPTVLDRNGDLPAAQKQLAAAAARVKALAPDKLAQLKLEILVEDTRPDDREIAERVVRALDKLGIVSTIKIEPAPAFASKVSRGQTDLWIGQLAVPITNASLWWSAAFAAGNDPWGMQQMAAGAVDSSAAHKQFADKLPIVPLMFRSVRFWHRIDVRGLVFDPSGRPCFAEVFLHGEAVRSPRARGKR